MEAITAANYTDVAEDKEVYLPEDMTFHSMPIYADYVHDLTITIDGTIKASKRHHVWPTTKTYNHTTGELIKTKIRDFFAFEEFHNFKMHGKGTVDGQGYMWWMREYIQRNPYGRPCLIKFNHGTKLEFTGIRWLNAPYYHLDIQDFDGAWFHDFEIYVEAKGQLELKLLLGED